MTQPLYSPTDVEVTPVVPRPASMGGAVSRGGKENNNGVTANVTEMSHSESHRSPCTKFSTLPPAEGSLITSAGRIKMSITRLPRRSKVSQVF